MRIVGAFACVLLLVACTQPLADHPHPTGDSSAHSACGTLRAHPLNIVGDFVEVGELRDAVRKMYEDAKGSETPGVAASAKEMLVVVANGYEDRAFRQAEKGVDRACSAAGD